MPVRTTLPSFSGTQTVWLSQYVETFVFAGALAGKAVEPYGIKGTLDGL